MIFTKVLVGTKALEPQVIEPLASSADRVDVKSVMEFFNIGKSLFYGKYLADCGIKPTKVGAYSYISQEDFELLKDYHLAKGKSKEALAAFLAKLGGKLSNQSTLEREYNLDSVPVQSQALNGLISIIEKLLHTEDEPTTDDGLSYEQMAAKLSARLTLLQHYSEYPDARLTGKELARILEISHKTLYGKKEYSKVGFKFISDRQGWQVIRIEKAAKSAAEIETVDFNNL